MGKKVMLAVAGAGKTYRLCNIISANRKNLIIAYTHQNIDNIEKELLKAFGKIPEKTKIMTFHRFVYQCFLCPYEPLILAAFSCEGFKKNGVTTTQVPPSKTIKRNGRQIINPDYKLDSLFGHYIFNNYYYCCYMSKLIIKADARNDEIIQRAMTGLCKFFEDIYIDEFQDFREYDFELLSKVIKLCENIMLVGDFYQHSVNAQNNSGKPFKNRKGKITYKEYQTMLKKQGLSVDNTSLQKTRRCPEKICDFIQEKLEIQFEADNDNIGKVHFVSKKEEIREILNNSSIVKLLYKESGKYNLNCMNWGYSKGDTYSHVCVILTGSLSKLENEEFNISSVSDIMRNKLYVALTRTAGNLYLINKMTFDQVKHLYIKREAT